MRAARRRQGVFLDRDGVLVRAPVQNGLPYSPRTLDEVDILPGVLEACAALKTAGRVLIVVTNQPDIARGTQRREAVDAINGFLRDRLRLDDVRVCPHDDGDACECRKPRPGMLVDAARDWNVELRRSVMVGDRWRDIEAGRAAGCRTVLVHYAYDELPPPAPDLSVGKLAEAVPWILDAGGLAGAES